MLSSKEIRKQFIDFFESKQHKAVPSAPVIPIDDPTLLFTNAGMNQFKKIFLGQVEPKYPRVVDTQKCIRAGGKHNDLDEVGRDGYHHTFFEMLGNWSFGDYYKKEAISWAWELLTDVWELPKDLLYATVHTSDEEAFNLWKSETDINPNHIEYHDDEDNFWKMGNTGPCGPCSEIHIDRGIEFCNLQNDPDHTCKVNGDCHRFIELWNLVFIQFNSEEDGSLVPLKNKYVDTGAGFERICQVLQNKDSNYHTDLFMPLIERIEQISGIKYHKDERGTSHRVITDHVRALSFALADGGLPSNEKSVFMLYDTYGFPLDLTKIMAEEKGLIVDEEGFQTEMKKQKQRAREAGKFILKLDDTEWTEFKPSKETEFLGYTENIAKCYIQKYHIDAENNVKIVLDRTPFYAESGGQVGDSGKIYNKNCEILITDVKKANDDFIHLGKLTKGKINKDEFIAEINVVNRKSIARNHTATHLLHRALRDVLGDHVQQKGSLVHPDHLRFDFTHFQQVSKHELDIVERTVNAKVRECFALDTEIKSIDEAKKAGAMALFGEKYGEIVRVVTIGDYSKELCGGTHLNYTGEIGYFKITSEKSAGSALDDMISKALEVNGIKLVIAKVNIPNPGMLRQIGDQLRDKIKSGIGVLFADVGGKVSILVIVTKDLTQQYHAGKIIGKVAELVGGKGGGRPDMAMAGGKDANKIPEVMTKVKEIIKGI